jgi:hypothetical protein
MSSDKLKNDPNFDQKCRLWRNEKNRRFVIFRTTFLRFLSILVPIRIYRKTGPTKSTVLGPRPPPGENIKFIDFSWFLTILGPSIEPEKGEVKSASTPYPPWKVNFIGIFTFWDSTFRFWLLFYVWDVCCVLSFTLSFLVFRRVVGYRVFLYWHFVDFVWFVLVRSAYLNMVKSTTWQHRRRLALKRAKQGIFVVLCFNLSRPKPRWVLIIHYPIDQEQT